MRNSLIAFVVLLGVWAGPSGPVRACGFGEAPGDCGQTPESEARHMLTRVVAALKADKARALAEFTKGENGFRTVDNYVFCVGPSGVMEAHPSPALQGTDVRDLHDSKGNHFIATMLERAQAGKVASIRYLFPRPGGTQEIAKVTFYTRAGDEVCGVGVYDGSEETNRAQTSQERLALLRTRLGAGIPADLRGDWAAYQALLDEERAARVAALDRVREQVRAAEAVLAGTPEAGR